MKVQIRITKFMQVAARVTAVCLLTQGAVVLADENPFSDYNRGLNEGVQKILLRSAELMPEEHYGFRPTESVRSFGEIVAHVADSQYTFCSRVLGEATPPGISRRRARSRISSQRFGRRSLTAVKHSMD